MFAALYDRVIGLSRHRRAPWWLAGLSAAESSFFPIPPDVMLAPMCLAEPRRSWRFAGLCTIASVAGGVLGYAIGRLGFQLVEPLFERPGLAEPFAAAVAAFEQYGFWYILLAGFTPIPYKIFTIAAGVVGMPLLPFVAGSLVGRGGRFFLVAGLIRLGGENAAAHLRRHVDWLGWTVLVVIVLAFIAWRALGGHQ